MTTLADAVDALVADADEGVDFEGLVADREGGTFRLAVPDAESSGLSESAFRDAARRHDGFVTEWHFWRRLAPAAPDRREFLRWLERADDRAVPDRRGALADGVSRAWGQLRVTVTAGPSGVRSYEVRHEADADRPVEDLSVVEDAHELRSVVRYDDRGRYRPLATAPTLPTGWVVPDRDPDGSIRTVEAVYPATIADWYRERTGNLDVTHWRETAARQTGIYDVVEELSGDRVEWLAEACCVDSQCIKRREWDETDGSTLDVPRGDGEFPCREPCSFAIAAAREALLAEREGPSDGGDSPAPSDVAQLQRILEAVAEGEVEAVRDGDLDDAANRHRARYLRAELRDEGVFGWNRSAGGGEDDG